MLIKQFCSLQSSSICMTSQNTKSHLISLLKGRNLFNTKSWWWRHNFWKFLSVIWLPFNYYYYYCYSLFNCLFNPNMLWCNHKLPNRDLYQNCKKNSQDRQLCCFNSVSFYSISELIVTTVNDCPETSIENEQQLKPQNNVINLNHLLLNKYMYVKQVYIVRRKKS